jgi:NAD(P)-dependent dehydrogenase (short-subunit alcohol dehydrogenase family)
MTVRLDGRVVVITGANRGVGRGLALAFGAAGARVVATARDVEGGHATAVAKRPSPAAT